MYLFLLATFSLFGCMESIPDMKTDSIKTDSKFEYLLCMPKNSVKGLVVLFPSFGNSNQSTLIETELDEFGDETGFAILIIGFNQSFSLNESKFKELSGLISRVLENNSIPHNITMGGLSVGGNIALNYGIFAKKNNIEPIPTHLFVIDSPVDLFVLYRNQLIAKRANHNPQTFEEAVFIIDYLEYELGKHELTLNDFKNYSPYLIDAKENNQLEYLRDYKISFYVDPDESWYMENMGLELNSTNSQQIKSMVHALSEINKNVRLVNALGKGFKADGTRHPHSWSILDEKEFYNWILKKKTDFMADSEKPE
ncbi:hypothetical protein Murru_3253 [Allomuricauda ruestringensis DSM 13258]|uniref:Alpha/beta hydrolase n=2 Tax=Flagellimonas TaxID=444459 RepID=G2PMD9_ALLRU|nr:hypothetical protein Murru_3253 [Allomuricauda ruestringensis DSM 13258]